jgi:hypothetical protein
MLVCLQKILLSLIKNCFLMNKFRVMNFRYPMTLTLQKLQQLK